MQVNRESEDTKQQPQETKETKPREQSFADLKLMLTEDDIDQITTLICVHCMQKTHNRVRSILRYHPSSTGNYGIYSRLTKSHMGIWEYTAGQSYTDEIRTLRECILGIIY